MVEGSGTLDLRRSTFDVVLVRDGRELSHALLFRAHERD
jgi:hypothetical protein